MTNSKIYASIRHVADSKIEGGRMIKHLPRKGDKIVIDETAEQYVVVDLVWNIFEDEVLIFIDDVKV